MGIKQFNKEQRSRPYRKAHWSESPETTKDVFDGRKPLRNLMVMIDHELLDESDGKMPDKPTKDILLKSLLYNDLVECYRYVEDTPPPSAQIVEFAYKTEPAYVGYVVLYTDNSKGFWPVTYARNDKSLSSSAITGNLYQIARDDVRDKTYLSVDAANKRQADTLALQVAQEALETDIYITRRPYLHSGSGIVHGRSVTVCTPEDAITLVSLYLRAQQEFIIPTGQKKFTMTLNRGLFYWVGTRELLPAGWRWFSACVYHSSGTKNDKLTYLGGATLSRVQRALEFRDEVHMAISSQTNNDINDNALGGIDSVLMLLMGAVDASARVVHYVLGLDDTKSYNAAWQKDSWLKQVKAIDAKLVDVVAKNTDGWYALTILSKLRNSIHGEPIRGMTKQDSSKTETVIALPSDDEAMILRAMDALGGRDVWGVKQLTANFNEVNPGILVDKLFEEVAKLLNDIMKNTPVEKLSYIEKAKKTNSPPDDKPGDPFSEWNRTTIRWQLGF